ncbi:hypothetical protein [Pseudaestuariivita sp.]
MLGGPFRFLRDHEMGVEVQLREMPMRTYGLVAALQDEAFQA